MSAPCHCQVSDSGGETCCGSPTPPWREPALTCSSPSPVTIPPATCGRSSRRNDASQPKVPVVPERLLGTSPVSTLKVMNVLVWLHVGLKGSACEYSRLVNTCNHQIIEELKLNRWMNILSMYNKKDIFQSNQCISIHPSGTWTRKKAIISKWENVFFPHPRVFSALSKASDCLHAQRGSLLLAVVPAVGLLQGRRLVPSSRAWQRKHSGGSF